MDKRMNRHSPILEQPVALHEVPTDLGIYIHIPFCIKRCHFCAFYLVMHETQRVEQFLRALEQEIVMYAEQQGLGQRSVSTVYFGGGTPTTLAPAQMASILACLKSYFSFTEPCEITVEATPESLTVEYADWLRQAGVTRLSLGIQSFVQQERRQLGLSGSVADAFTGIHRAKQAGFPDLNLDLIYGLPGQSCGSWEKTLAQAMEFAPTHLSSYALSLEEGTRFYAEFRRGALQVPNPDDELEFQFRAETHLGQGGYDRYELSNWAKPGHACRHNLRYWQGLDYLGLGPSAQSYVSGCRFGNASNLYQYTKQLEAGEWPVVERERLSTSRQEKERVLFGLRLLQGIPLDWIQSLAQDVAWARSLNKLLQEDYLLQVNSRLQLTPKGRRFADSVGMHLLSG
jgi:oxygen-independent coproporphyrinogen-3 oxidase